MTLKILDVRIGQVGVEASRASLEKAAPGPLGGIGYSLAYRKAFAEAQGGGGGGHALPWDSQQPYRNKFWRKYATDRMLGEDPKRWADVAWNVLVPFKATPALPRIHLHPDEVRSYSESYAWPTGVGLIWNSSIRTSTDVDGLISILATIRNGRVPFTAADGTDGALPMRTLYHQMLDSVRDQLWGTQQKGLRSEPLTIVSIVQAEADPAEPQAVPEALQRLLDGIAREWNVRPATLPGDVRAASGGTVYAAEGLRLAWVPANFLSQSRGRPGNCLHRNLLLASAQVEMLAAAARMLATHKRNSGLPNFFESTVERVLENSAAILSGDSYSAPHLRAQLERQPVTHALSELSEP